MAGWGWMRDRLTTPAAQVWDLFLDGTIVPYTGKIFPLEAWEEAGEEAIKTGRGGKVLLEG